MNKWNLIIYIVLAISVIANLVLFMSLGVNEIMWEEDYNQNNIEWCEHVNDYNDVVNDLVLKLQAYNPAYLDVGYIDQVDCWSEDE